MCKISIIITTFNRYYLLEFSLLSLLKQQCNNSFFEIIVIDNNSTDNTLKVIDKIKLLTKIPITYQKELSQGLSHARNRGISLASGDILVFIDDDELATPTWLHEIVKTYAIDNKIACVGGRIIPIFPDEQLPSWYSHELQRFYGGVDNGNEVIELNPKTQFLGGGNLSFKRKTLIDLGMFDRDLGIRSETFYGGEETALYLKAIKHGHKVFYNPKALTYHIIEKNRLNTRYLYKRAFQNGISDAIHDFNWKSHALDDSDRKMSLFNWYLLILIKSLLSFVKRGIILRRSSLNARLAILRSIGKIFGLLSISRSSTLPSLQ